MEGVEESRDELGVRVDLTQHPCSDGKISVQPDGDRDILHVLCPLLVGHLGVDKTWKLLTEIEFLFNFDSLENVDFVKNLASLLKMNNFGFDVLLY